MSLQEKDQETEVATGNNLWEKAVFLEISENSQENTCSRVSFLIKLLAEACNFIKTETLVHIFFCEVLQNF